MGFRSGIGADQSRSSRPNWEHHFFMDLALRTGRLLGHLAALFLCGYLRVCYHLYMDTWKSILALIIMSTYQRNREVVFKSSSILCLHKSGYKKLFKKDEWKVLLPSEGVVRTAEPTFIYKTVSVSYCTFGRTVTWVLWSDESCCGLKLVLLLSAVCSL